MYILKNQLQKNIKFWNVKLNDCPEIVWRLFVKYDYLSFKIPNNENKVFNNEILKIFDYEKIKNEKWNNIKYFNIIKLSDWKECLYTSIYIKRNKNIIKLFIKNNDKEKIKESLHNLIIKDNSSKNEFLDRWYSLIYSLNNQVVVVNKKKKIF